MPERFIVAKVLPRGYRYSIPSTGVTPGMPDVSAVARSSFEPDAEQATDIPQWATELEFGDGSTVESVRLGTADVRRNTSGCAAESAHMMFGSIHSYLQYTYQPQELLKFSTRVGCVPDHRRPAAIRSMPGRESLPNTVLEGPSEGGTDAFLDSYSVDRFVSIDASCRDQTKLTQTYRADFLDVGEAWLRKNRSDLKGLEAITERLRALLEERQ
ncbi:MAG: hypothetical protein IPH03_08150 [Tetrasphaera sp.]|nr:hypothetical protein [Tetrasphaera sp.]